MKPALIITRPLSDSLHIAQHIEKSGYQALVEPSLTIEIRDTAQMEVVDYLYTGVRGVIVTSKYAVMALQKFSIERTFPIIAIGPTTAHMAMKAGFSAVEHAEGNATALVDYVQNHYPPEGKPFLYAAGHDITVDIANMLLAAGYAAHKIVVYKANPTETLSPAAITLIKANAIKGVLFFSIRSAGIFMEQLKARGLEKHSTFMQAFCMSPAIAATLKPDQWKAIHAAALPHSASIVELATGVRL